jgi:hypothetical protein
MVPNRPKYHILKVIYCIFIFRNNELFEHRKATRLSSIVYLGAGLVRYNIFSLNFFANTTPLTLFAASQGNLLYFYPIQNNY